MLKKLLTKQTIGNAILNGYKNPHKIVKNIDPGIANVCKLKF